MPVALKVSIGLKSEMHLKENIKMLILVAPETQVVKSAYNVVEVIVIGGRAPERES